MDNKAAAQPSVRPPPRPHEQTLADAGRDENMDEDITLYFGSVAEIWIVAAVVTISGAALTHAFSVLKNHHQRRSQSPYQPTSLDSLATMLLTAVPLVLAVYLIKAFVRPSWITLGVAGAIAIIQIVLNCIVTRDLQSSLLRLRNEIV